MFDEILQEIIINPEDHELNLRQFRVVGGVYFIEIFYQPPQPSGSVLRDITFTTRNILFLIFHKLFVKYKFFSAVAGGFDAGALHLQQVKAIF